MLGSPFAETVWRTGIRGLRGGSFGGLLCSHWAFLAAECLKPALSVPAWRRAGQCYQDVDLGLKELLLGTQPSFISLCSSRRFGRTVGKVA